MTVPRHDLNGATRVPRGGDARREVSSGRRRREPRRLREPGRSSLPPSAPPRPSRGQLTPTADGRPAESQHLRGTGAYALDGVSGPLHGFGGHTANRTGIDDAAGGGVRQPAERAANRSGGADGAASRADRARSEQGADRPDPAEGDDDGVGGRVHEADRHRLNAVERRSNRREQRTTGGGVGSAPRRPLSGFPARCSSRHRCDLPHDSTLTR
jgi:hypothetical protein